METQNPGNFPLRGIFKVNTKSGRCRFSGFRRRKKTQRFVEHFLQKFQLYRLIYEVSQKAKLRLRVIVRRKIKKYSH